MRFRFRFAPFLPFAAALIFASPAPAAPSGPKPAANVAQSGHVPKYLAGVPLIPRSTLFGNPDHAAPRISPDAKQLAYLAPLEGVLNVWVGPRDKPEAAKPVTHDTKRGIRSYFWAYNNHQIIYLQDKKGDENWHVYLVDLDTGKTTDLTPLPGVRAQIEAVSYRFPSEILIGLNQRDPRVFDIHRLDLKTGERRLVLKNTEDFSSFVIDDDYRIRFADKMTDNGGKVIMEPDGKGGWKTFLTISEDNALTTSPIGLDKSGNVLYMLDSRGRDTAALTSYDLKTGQEKVLAENPRADVDKVLMRPVENRPLAVSFDYQRETWHALDPSVAQDFKRLHALSRGDIEFSSQSLGDRHWIVAFLEDDGPVRFYDFNRKEQQGHFLFTSQKTLEGLPLVRMHPVIIKSRDGLNLVSYLTLPRGTNPGGHDRPSRPLPMVLDVHGGPWARDSWGYDPECQLWANRGYAVLQVNYRGSTGLGKAFVNAGNRQWGGKMQDDLVDAVHWAIQEKIADPKRVAIMGGSYGGYATLMGLVETPDLYACGVDVVGPTDLLTLIQTVPPYWKPDLALFRVRVGDDQTAAGRKFLEDRSPLPHVDKIQRPLLIAEGANDPRVKIEQANQLVAAMERKHIPVTYVVFPDEGHGFARPVNRLAFYAVADAFLAEHLDGRYQPIGNALAASTITVPAGANQVAGLETALAEKKVAGARKQVLSKAEQFSDKSGPGPSQGLLLKKKYKTTVTRACFGK